MSIQSTEQYKIAAQELETLLMKGVSKLTKAEDFRLDELTDAIEEYEGNQILFI